MFVVLALLVAGTLAASADNYKDATVLRFDFDNIGVDSYNYNVETSDGKKIVESGQLRNVGTDDEAIEVQGQFSYPGPDGQIYLVTYIANELGFQPKGAHLPQTS